MTRSEYAANVALQQSAQKPSDSWMEPSRVELCQRAQRRTWFDHAFTVSMGAVCAGLVFGVCLAVDSMARGL